VNQAELNPPELLNSPRLAAAINARGFSGAAGFRTITIEPGYAELASGSIGVATVEVFSKKDAAETLCAFCSATMRALDLPAEFR